MARRMKGEGSLYQTKDRVWIYQYQIDGQRKTKRFKKKSDANAFIKALAAGTTNVTAKEPESNSAKTAEEIPETVTESAVKIETAESQKPENTDETTHEKLAVQTVNETPATPQIQAGTQNVSEIITPGEWLDRWLEIYIRPTVKLSTYCSYELYIRGHS